MDNTERKRSIKYSCVFLAFLNGFIILIWINHLSSAIDEVQSAFNKLSAESGYGSGGVVPTVGESEYEEDADEHGYAEVDERKLGQAKCDDYEVLRPTVTKKSNIDEIYENMEVSVEVNPTGKMKVQLQKSKDRIVNKSKISTPGGYNVKKGSCKESSATGHTGNTRGQTQTKLKPVSMDALKEAFGNGRNRHKRVSVASVKSIPYTEGTVPKNLNLPERDSFLPKCGSESKLDSVRCGFQSISLVDYDPFSSVKDGQERGIRNTNSDNSSEGDSSATETIYRKFGREDYHQEMKKQVKKDGGYDGSTSSVPGTNFGIGQWAKCFQMTDDRSRMNEANRLLSWKILPDHSQLERACIVFGRWSDTFFAICKAISEYIRTVSTEIIDVWAAYRCSDFQKCSNIEIVFVIITNTGKADIKVGDYEIYERGQSLFSMESTEVMICVEMAQKRGYEFDESDLLALENCVSENAEIIMNSHEKLCVMSPCVKKSKAFGKENASISDKLCISLYVHIKGLIPIAERPFPTKIGNFPTDVLEDTFTSFHGGPFHYHEHLKMGLAIHANATDNQGALLVGTLGGFLDHPATGLCGLTCAHVVLSGDEMLALKTRGRLDFSNYNKEVLQPIDSSARAFGQVLSARYSEGGHGSAGMEAALFQICQREPIDGFFPTAENYNNAGFDENNPMVYKTGKVCEVSQIRRRAEVYKYGITTGVTRGSLGLRGSVIRTTEMSGQCQTLTYRLYNQIEIIRIDEQDFALPGDSGGLVFFDDKSDHSVAIGIVEGGQNNRKVFVTPICDILQNFDCPLNMKKFNEPMEYEDSQ